MQNTERNQQYMHIHRHNWYVPYIEKYPTYHHPQPNFILMMTLLYNTTWGFSPKGKWNLVVLVSAKLLLIHALCECILNAWLHIHAWTKARGEQGSPESETVGFSKVVSRQAGESAPSQVHSTASYILIQSSQVHTKLLFPNHGMHFC